MHIASGMFRLGEPPVFAGVAGMAGVAGVEGVVEIRDPSVIQRVLMGGGGEIDIYQD